MTVREKERTLGKVLNTNLKWNEFNIIQLFHHIV